MTVQYVRWRKKEGEVAPRGPWFQRRTYVTYRESWSGIELDFPERDREYVFGWGGWLIIKIFTKKRIYQ